MTHRLTTILFLGAFLAACTSGDSKDDKTTTEETETNQSDGADAGTQATVPDAGTDASCEKRDECDQRCDAAKPEEQAECNELCAEIKCDGDDEEDRCPDLGDCASACLEGQDAGEYVECLQACIDEC